MFSRFMFSTIITLLLFISAAISDLDSTQSLQDDSLFGDAELPSKDPEPFSLDQSLVPLDPNAPLFGSVQTFEDSVSSTNIDSNTSDEVPWNINSGIISLSSGTDNINNKVNDEFSFLYDDDDSFQLANCPTSESLLSTFDISKSRLRRGNSGGEKCTNPDTTAPMNSQSFPSFSFPYSNDLQDLYKDALDSPEMSNRATATLFIGSDHNGPCNLITNGQLPWGVCSSGQPAEQLQLRTRFTYVRSRLVTWQLSGATLAPGQLLICLDPTLQQQLYCCGIYVFSESLGAPCVLLKDILFATL